jgi:hypothetical protein
MRLGSFLLATHCASIAVISFVIRVRSALNVMSSERPAAVPTRHVASYDNVGVIHTTSRHRIARYAPTVMDVPFGLACSKAGQAAPACLPLASSHREAQRDQSRARALVILDCGNACPFDTSAGRECREVAWTARSCPPGLWYRECAGLVDQASRLLVPYLAL